MVNTSVTRITLDDWRIDESKVTTVEKLLARNKRLRCLFLYNARRMLLSLMCADECSVVWPYVLESDDTAGMQASDDIATLRAAFAAIVDERRRRRAAVVGELDEVAAGVSDRDARAAKRRRTTQ
jgi:hypothetical protein